MTDAGRPAQLDADKLDEMVAEADTGGRQPPGIVGRVLIGVALAWTLFQLWFASPLPFILNFGVLNSTEARAIHLAFALFLAYTAFPAFRTSPRHRVPPHDWALAALGSVCAGYIFVMSEELARRPGLPTTLDMAVGVTGLLVLLEATRRALGPPLTVVAAVFMGYAFLGPWMPDVIAHKGASLSKGVSHYWLSTEGVFGVALDVSTTMVFLFVLFGALLERAGAGNYFIRVAFALLGHLRGGPAKAAVLSSGMTGLISGSSIANVVTTGTFTIPLMRKLGFSAEKAGAVEVASSTNGQLTPPVMGAAAFLMVEFVGISYQEVIKHAFLPAIISYIGLIYIVHLEAVRMGMEGLPRRRGSSRLGALLSFAATLLGLIILSGVVYYGLGWVKVVAGPATPYIATALLVVAYLGLIAYAARFPELETEPSITELPEPGPTIKVGLYYLLPVVVLVWSLVVERLSPGLSAFWAAAFMMVIVITHRPLLALFRSRGEAAAELRRGFGDLFHGLVNGARNMIGIGLATATAGIVVGTVTLTGIGLVMTEFVEFISGGNLVLILVFTAIISLILGMGLPTTANYIVVSTLMAPVIVSLGAQAGLVVPLIAVHMFVFYFGILADDTPPVGLAAFAAAAISGGDPIRTGIQGFMYDIRTAILPFMFIFNTKLLMIGIAGVLDFLVVVAAAVLAMLSFAAATQGLMIVRNRLYETAVLLLVAFTLFRPGFWWDMIYPPLEAVPPTQVAAAAAAKPPNAMIRLRVAGETIEGEIVDKAVMLPLGPRREPRSGELRGGEERLREAAGLTLRVEDERVMVGNVVFGGAADKAGIEFGWELVSIQMEADRPPKELMYVPALLLLAGVYAGQHARRRRQAKA